MKKQKSVRNSFLLVLTAFIWGCAFVAQRSGGDVIGPLSFNSIRSIIGFVVLLPVIALLDRLHLTERTPKTPEEKKTLLIGGICCGIVLTIAANLQQLGIYLGVTAGKAGFLTACYIVIVPILGLFLKKRCGWNIWVGVALTLAGLYLLCMTESLSLKLEDLLVLACAFVFAIHILVIDHFSPLVDGVRMSAIQFLVCGIFSGIPAIFTEMKPFTGGLSPWLTSLTTWDAWIPILYAGIMSCGVAYTLQIVGQEDVNPTVASLLMSLESVFAVIAGAVILGEKLSSRELFGCVLIMAAVVLAQIPLSKQKS